MNDEKDLVTKHLQYAQPQPVSARKAAPIAPAETLDELRALVDGVHQVRSVRNSARRSCSVLAIRTRVFS